MVGKGLVSKAGEPYQAGDGAPHGVQKGIRQGVLCPDSVAAPATV